MRVRSRHQHMQYCSSAKPKQRKEPHYNLKTLIIIIFIISAKKQKDTSAIQEQFSIDDVDKTATCNYCKSVMNVHTRQ